MITKTKLTISRPLWSDGRKFIQIAIRDEASSVTAVELSVSCESFAQALTGLSFVDSTTEWVGLDRIGKTRVREERSIEAPSGIERSKYSEWLAEAGKEDGWIVDNYLGSQSSVTWKSGKTFLNYSVVKFVEETAMSADAMLAARKET